MIEPLLVELKLVKPLVCPRLAPLLAIPNALIRSSSGGDVGDVSVTLPELTPEPLLLLPTALLDWSLPDTRSGKEKKVAALLVGKLPLTCVKWTVMVLPLKACTTGAEKTRVRTLLLLVLSASLV